MVQQRDDVVLIDAAILGPPQVWEASGPPRQLHRPARRLHQLQATLPRSTSSTIPTPARTAASTARSPRPRQFNLMFKTHAGPVEDAGAVAYLRPETAQGMFINFANVLNTTRKKPPFGIAQVGKSFRNEITPQNWIFRTREFEQMEMEFFVPPAESAKWYEYWCSGAHGLVPRARHPRRRCCACAPHDADELSHYSSGTSDVEFMFPWGWDELEGIAQRTDYDLNQHADTLRREARLLRPDDRRALPAVRDRAGGRRHPRCSRSSCSPPTTRTSSTTRRAPCCACTRGWRRTRSPCSRCRRRTR